MKRVLAATIVAAVMSGCSGLEIGGKAWIASIDEKSESSRTYRSNVPLKCYFTDCADIVRPNQQNKQGVNE